MDHLIGPQSQTLRLRVTGDPVLVIIQNYWTDCWKKSLWLRWNRVFLVGVEEVVFVVAEDSTKGYLTMITQSVRSLVTTRREREGVSACSTALVHHHPPDPHRRPEKPDDDDDHLDAEEVTGDTIAQKTLDDDSGKSSMENVSSQADDVSRTSIVPSSSSPAGTPTDSHGNNIARCRPSPRHPVTEHSSPLLLNEISA